MVQLSDILNTEQQLEVMAILNSSVNEADKIARLKGYLKPYSWELETKGYNWEYLAYAIAYAATQTKESNEPKTSEQN